MYIENILINTNKIKSIKLYHLMLKNKKVLVTKNCKRILVILEQDFILNINDKKFCKSNKICFVDGNDKCEILVKENVLEVYCFEIEFNTSIASLDKNSFMNIDDNLLISCLLMKEIYEKNIENNRIIYQIVSYFIYTNELLNKNCKKNYVKCPKIIFDIKAYLEKNIDSKIQIKDISKKFYVSRSEVFYLFKKYTGTTVIEYLNTLRINKARNLLINSNYSISEISQIVGYDSLQYFSKVFKNKCGLSPSEFRKIEQITDLKGGENYEKLERHQII